MDEKKLFDSEYRLMELIWQEEPVRSTRLMQLAKEQLDWKKSTCYTVLKKLEAKGFVSNVNAVVTALISREKVQQEESQRVIARNFGGSLPAFVNAFLQDRKLSPGEAEEIRRMIEEATL